MRIPRIVPSNYKDYVKLLYTTNDIQRIVLFIYKLYMYNCFIKLIIFKAFVPQSVMKISSKEKIKPVYNCVVKLKIK